MSLPFTWGRIARSNLRPGKPVVLIHGGAGQADPRGNQASQAQLSLTRVVSALRSGRTFAPAYFSPTWARSEAEEITLAAAHLMEDDPLFNAGLGAFIQGDGQARVSASFMESRRGVFSSVINAMEVRHPSALAYFLQGQQFTQLDNLGTSRLCRQLGIPPEDLITSARFERWVELRRTQLEGQTVPPGHGTIGVLGADAAGQLAACTSTGGVGAEPPGRVGDSPTVAGNYCGKHIAVSCTGIGEQIVHHAFAARLCVRVDDGMSLVEALGRGMEEVIARNFHLAAITIGWQGEDLVWAAAGTEPYFVWRLMSETGDHDFLGVDPP